MRIRDKEDLKRFEETINQCRKPVWIVTPSGEQYNLKNPAQRAKGLACMQCKNEYEEPEVFALCAEDEMVLFGYIESCLSKAA